MLLNAGKCRGQAVCVSRQVIARCNTGVIQVITPVIACDDCLSDVDECSPGGRGPCEQLCINEPGSYRCQCHPGFTQPSHDPRRCVGASRDFAAHAPRSFPACDCDFFCMCVSATTLCASTSQPGVNRENDAYRRNK